MLIKLMHFIVLSQIIILASCVSSDKKNEDDTKEKVNTIKESQIINPKAEELIAKARVLWKQGSDVCGDPAMAVFLLDQAIEISSNNAEAYMRRGLAYSEMGKEQEAFNDLTQAIRLDPTSSRYAYRGLGLLRQQNFMGARKDLEKSLAIDSKQFRAWNYMGALNMLENDTAAACKDFEKACSNGDCAGINAAKKEGMCK